MANVELRVENFKEVQRQQAALELRVGRGITLSTRWLMNFVLRNHLRGGTSIDRLAVRSGNLRRQTVLKNAQRFGRFWIAKIFFGASYAGFHISDVPRSSTRIHPRTGRSRTYKTRVHLNDIILRNEIRMLSILKREVERNA